LRDFAAAGVLLYAERNHKQHMKKLISLFVALALLPGFLQAQPPGAMISARPGATPNPPTTEPPPPLPHFDIDFPGGTPNELVQAIQTASGHPLNAIIPTEAAHLTIPPLKLRTVTVAELFEALAAASQKTVSQVTGTYFGGVNGQASSQYQVVNVSYGFRTIGTPRVDSIWYFYQAAPTPPPGAEPNRVCRFYQLGPYLDNYTVEDITTAITSGWEMLRTGSDPELPQLSFHKNTKLLIAVGDPAKVEMIGTVLDHLNQKPTPKPPPVPAKSGDAAKP
jgi:hypothetical protein